MTPICRLSAFITPLLLAQCVADNSPSQAHPSEASQKPAPATSTVPQPSPIAEEIPATGPVPQSVINDCLAALRQQIPDRQMRVLSSRRGEASYIIDIAVVGVPNPWRCYHDGTRCTGTEYQGEG